jgi:hypothetical protein
VPPRAGPAGGLTDEQLGALWADLTGADAVRAFRALAGLADHPDQAGPFLREAVKRLPLLDGKRLARLIADLDADEFAARERASKGLAALGAAAAPALRAALRGKPSPEAAHRLRQLLKPLDDQNRSPETVRELQRIEALERAGPPPADTAPLRRLLNQLDDNRPSPEKVRVLRAVEALEHVGTAPAREALRAVAEGGGDPDVVRAAVASLRRLAARPASGP